MTRSIIKIKTTLLDHQIAQLSAIAIGLSLIESVLPSPMPGVKPGIANIITLYAMYRFNFRTAIWVSILRVFATSLMLGQFLSPTFMLSLAGSLLSLLTLYFSIKLPSRFLVLWVCLCSLRLLILQGNSYLFVCGSFLTPASIILFLFTVQQL